MFTDMVYRLRFEGEDTPGFIGFQALKINPDTVSSGTHIQRLFDTMALGNKEYKISGHNGSRECIPVAGQVMVRPVGGGMEMECKYSSRR